MPVPRAALVKMGFMEVTAATATTIIIIIIIMALVFGEFLWYASETAMYNGIYLINPIGCNEDHHSLS